MGNAIPSKIVRKVIFDILIERSNAIDYACDELIKKDMEAMGSVSDYAGELGWTACGTRVLADDILEGTMSLEEAVEVLTSEERKEAKSRCQKWLDKNAQDRQKLEQILKSESISEEDEKRDVDKEIEEEK